MVLCSQLCPLLHIFWEHTTNTYFAPLLSSTQIAGGMVQTEWKVLPHMYGIFFRFCHIESLGHLKKIPTGYWLSYFFSNSVWFNYKVPEGAILGKSVIFGKNPNFYILGRKFFFREDTMNFIEEKTNIFVWFNYEVPEGFFFNKVRHILPKFFFYS